MKETLCLFFLLSALVAVGGYIFSGMSFQKDDTTFKFKDQVRIRSGFYAGQVGFVDSVSGRKYLIRPFISRFEMPAHFEDKDNLEKNQ